MLASSILCIWLLSHAAAVTQPAPLEANHAGEYEGRSALATAVVIHTVLVVVIYRGLSVRGSTLHGTKLLLLFSEGHVIA